MHLPTRYYILRLTGRMAFSIAAPYILCQPALKPVTNLGKIKAMRQEHCSNDQLPTLVSLNDFHLKYVEYKFCRLGIEYTSYNKLSFKLLLGNLEMQTWTHNIFLIFYLGILIVKRRLLTH